MATFRYPAGRPTDDEDPDERTLRRKLSRDIFKKESPLTLISKGSSKQKPPPKLYPLRVFRPWYRRYASILPEDQQVMYQPYEEIDERESEIAFQQFYGNGDPSLSAEMIQNLRKTARRRWEVEKIREMTRIQEPPKTMGHITPTKRKCDTVSAILAKYQQNKKKTDEERKRGYTEEQKEVLAKTILFLSQLKNSRDKEGEDLQHFYERQPPKRLETSSPASPATWSSKLKTPMARMRLKSLHHEATTKLLRLKFTKVIKLVRCLMFVIKVFTRLADSHRVLKEMHDWRIEKEVKLKDNIDIHNHARLGFDSSQYRQDREMGISIKAKMTLTKPWFDRTEEEIEEARRSLRRVETFAKLPIPVQQMMAAVAWLLRVPEDKVIIREAQKAENYYILLTGRATKTKLVGSPYHMMEGGFRVEDMFDRDCMFGDEMLLQPYCDRKYSVMSITACELLSINLVDFQRFCLKDALEWTPDYLIFLSNMEFMRGIPMSKIIDKAEDNIYNFYIRPGIIVTKSVKNSDFVYLIKSGTARALVELPPVFKDEVVSAVRSTFASFNREREDSAKPILMGRMAVHRYKRISNSLNIQDDKSNNAYKSDLLNVTNSLTMGMSDKVERKVRRELLGVRREAMKFEHDCEDEIQEYELRRQSAFPTRAPNAPHIKFLSHETAAQKERTKDNIKSRNSLPNIRQTVASAAAAKRFANQQKSFEKKPRFELIEKIPESSKSPSLKDNSSESPVSSRVPSPSPKQQKVLSESLYKAQRKMTMHKNEVAYAIKELNHSVRERERLSISHKKSDVTRTQSLVKDTSKTRTKSTKIPLPKISMKDAEKQSSISSRKKSRIASRSTLEIYLNEDGSEYASSKSTADGALNCADKFNPKNYSRWKLHRQLLRGDSIGDEWRSWSATYIPEASAEDSSLVSDGCEIVMVRKSFIKRMCQDGKDKV